ncbi:MAG: hypothetical protein IPL28_19565 [Chloroflexi bacterium]|nr:hypothetical protein [Chloroflexota bacterium]
MTPQMLWGLRWVLDCWRRDSCLGRGTHLELVFGGYAVSHSWFGVLWVFRPLFCNR